MSQKNLHNSISRMLSSDEMKEDGKQEIREFEEDLASLKHEKTRFVSRVQSNIKTEI